MFLHVGAVAGGKEGGEGGVLGGGSGGEERAAGEGWHCDFVGCGCVCLITLHRSTLEMLFSGGGDVLGVMFSACQGKYSA